MVVETSGMVHSVIMGLTTHVFGSVAFTCLFIMLLLVLVSILIRIPIPFALAIPIPLAIVFAAFGYMSILAAAILSLIFMVIAIGSFLAGLNIT